MPTEHRGKGPLAGWKASFEETTDTFDIDEFLKTDGPTNAKGLADLKRAIIEGGTFGDYRRLESDHTDEYNFFVLGPNSILNARKEDRLRLLVALDTLDQADLSPKHAEE